MQIIAPVVIANEVASPVTRASTATYWDRLGVLQTAAANTLRVTYDPLDLKAAPYPLIEPEATNYIRNNTMQGAAPGVPGTRPTGWGFSWATSSAISGVSASISTVNVEDGIEYVDVRFQGTFTGATGTWQQLAFGGSTDIPTATGETWAQTIFLRHVGGALGTATFSIRLDLRDSGNAGLTTTTSGNFPVSSAALSLQRYEYVHTINPANVAYIVPMLRVALVNGETYDFTIRIGLPQFERDRVTSPIKTTNAAVTRAADVLSSSHGLYYSNLLENDADDAPLWVGGQAVAKDQYRRRAETHKVYRALQAVPTGISAPPETEPKDASGNPYWYEWEPTNRWAAFDTTLDTAAIGADVVQWVVRPDQIVGALAVLSADATDIRIAAVTGGGKLVYQQSKRLLMSNSRSWSDYFFKPRERRSDDVFFDLPFIKGPLICITVSKPGSTAKVGDIKMGRIEDIGETLVEPEIRTLRRSSIKDDGYGRYRFNRKPSSKIMSANVYLDPARLDTVVRMIDKYTAEPCVIIGDERWTSLILLAYVDDFSVVLRDSNTANYNLKAIGLG